MNARRLIASLAVFAVVVAGIGASIIFVNASKPTPPAASQTSRQPPPPPLPQVPIPAEFQIGVVVMDQNCSGPNGCVYKYHIEPKYIGMHPLPEKEIKVVYQVTGGNQPQVGDFTVQGGQARVLQEVTLEGPPGASLQASVTQIIG